MPQAGTCLPVSPLVHRGPFSAEQSGWPFKNISQIKTFPWLLISLCPIPYPSELLSVLTIFLKISVFLVL